MARLVVFDMDGVLADTESSSVYVHKHFGVSNDHSLYAYLRGEIADLEFIRRDIELWRQKAPDITAKRIRKLLDAVPLMPGAKNAISGLRNRGFRTAIVSAGIALLSERIARELGIDAQLANGFVLDKRGSASRPERLSRPLSASVVITLASRLRLRPSSAASHAGSE